MGYELENTTVFGIAAANLSDLQQARDDARHCLGKAIADGHGLAGRLATDDPLWMAAQIRIADARQRCADTHDAFLALTLDLP
jgi:hypothetical protein